MVKVEEIRQLKTFVHLEELKMEKVVTLIAWIMWDGTMTFSPPTFLSPATRCRFTCPRVPRSPDSLPQSIPHTAASNFFNWVGVGTMKYAKNQIHEESTVLAMRTLAARDGWRACHLDMRARIFSRTTSNRAESGSEVL